MVEQREFCAITDCGNRVYHETARYCRKHFEDRQTWMSHSFEEASGCWRVATKLTDLDLRVVFFLWNDQQARTDRIVTNDPFRCRNRGYCCNPRHVIEMTEYEASVWK